jgi:Concanavalin A-like lectin/glucanases superfamily/Right handed beta helix region
LLLALVFARARLCSRPSRSRLAVASLAVLLIAATAVLSGLSPAAGAPTCSRVATPSSFASQVSAASAGETICLSSGDYGTWYGTNKGITVTAASGSRPTMRFSFGPGTGGFTLDGMTDMAGTVWGGTAITVRNSTFSDSVSFDGGTAMVFDHNNLTFGDTNGCCKIRVDSTSGTLAAPALTISNNLIENGQADGIQFDGSPSGVQVVGNTFEHLCDIGQNHTDNIQFYADAAQDRLADNYVYEAPGCATQGITSYDGGTNGVIIEDNVIDIPRDWGIELYADRDSIVRHNTVVWHPKSYSDFKTGTGRIALDHKSQDPPGSSTQIYDNIATSVDFDNGSSGNAYNNVSGQRAIFVGPTTTWAGFRLAVNSPVGRHAASDGLDAGARIAPVPQPPPESPAPSTSPPPERKPAPPHKRARRSHRWPQLVASFGFDESSGSTVLDRSGMNNDASIHGARRIRTGKHGRALAFDGVDDYINVPDSKTLNLVRGMTLEAWVRPAGASRGWRSVILKAVRGRRSYGLYVNNRRGRVSAFIRARRRYSTRGGGLRRNRWSYVAATYNGRMLRVYINGRLRSSRGARGAIRAVGGSMTIGRSNLAGGWFNGAIDDVRVWRGALSPRSVRSQMRADASVAQTLGRS